MLAVVSQSCWGGCCRGDGREWRGEGVVGRGGFVVAVVDIGVVLSSLSLSHILRWGGVRVVPQSRNFLEDFLA